MDLLLDHKTALVTGSSKGIGSAIAAALARENARVVVHGRDAAQAESVVNSIVTEGGWAAAVSGDLTNDSDVRRLVAQARHHVGSIDILVNNAGGSGVRRDWQNVVVEEWSTSYDRNVLAALRTTGEVLPAMRERRWGRIINISSGAASMPPEVGADYAAAKAAINVITASLAKAVAAEGITVNTISPGTIRSARLEEGFRKTAATRGLADPDAAWTEIERVVLPLFAAVPAGRVGEVDELANVVAFLASPRAAYVTGTNLHVDGGFSSLP